ncbi:hypothetical protein [Saccharopolyspora phatthalungensis]|uniref:Uncharacterized protein n=1 Tax=Saccharopolyspora phatthalungensis TaxID=664693 RepID=A0A840QCF9_9PSEU|nr:hypothetical protein [Saccharopolyspora phatthalungensis]MBB5154583.1 hypothetical protein [Saccharopolyspora phatthalungensis]
MALGRTKPARRQQKAAEPAERDHELDSYLAALAPEENVETTGSGRRFGGSQVYQLRLPLMANERLRELAFKQGTSPAALARDWVMQHLAEAEADPGSGQAPAWPGQDTQQDLRAASEPLGAPTGFPTDVEQTEEITVPHERFRH